MVQKGLAPILIVLLIAAAIGGYLIYSGKINLSQKVTTPQQTTQSSQTSEEINGKIYTNKKFNFSLSYPKDWKVIASNDDKLRISSSSNEIEINITPFDISTGDSGLGGGGQALRTEDVQIGGINTVKRFYKNGDLNVMMIQLNKGSIYYPISVTNKTDDFSQVNQILSTFKFLDQNATDTSNWKTYANGKFGFSIKYPNDWTMGSPAKSDPSEIMRFEKPLNDNDKNAIEPVIFRLSIYVMDSKGATSANQYIDNRLRELQHPTLGGITLSKRMNYQVGGVEGVWTEGFPSRAGTIEVYVLKNNKIYEFMLEPYDDQISEWRPTELRSAFEKMLATFEFQ